MGNKLISIQVPGLGKDAQAERAFDRALETMRRTDVSISRSFVKALFEVGGVKNARGKILRPSDKTRDALCIEYPRNELSEPLMIESSPVEILFHHKDFIAVNKPAGVYCGKTPNTDILKNNKNFSKSELSPDSSFTQRVYLQMQNKFLEPDIPELGLVHRLDYGTSGVLIFALHKKAYHVLREAFRRHEIIKTYLLRCARTEKAREETQWIMETPLSKKGVPVRACTQNELFLGRALSAKTEFQVIAHEQDGTLLRALCSTGRRHQVRVHARISGYPILGDELYGPDDQVRSNSRKGKKDKSLLCLHAESALLPRSVFLGLGQEEDSLLLRAACSWVT